MQLRHNYNLEDIGGGSRVEIEKDLSNKEDKVELSVEKNSQAEANLEKLEKSEESLVQEVKVEKKKKDFWSKENLTDLICKRAETCGDDFGLKSFDIRGKSKNQEEKDAKKMYNYVKRSGIKNVMTIFESKKIKFDFDKKTLGEVIDKLVEVLTPDLYKKYKEDKFWNQNNITKVILDRARTCGDDFSPLSFNLAGKWTNQQERDASRLYNCCSNRGVKKMIQKIFDENGIEFVAGDKGQGEILDKLVQTFAPIQYEIYKKRDFWTEDNLEKVIRRRAQAEGENFGIVSFNLCRKGKNQEERDGINLYNSCKNAGLKKLQKIFDDRNMKFAVNEHSMGEVVMELIRVLTPDLVKDVKELKIVQRKEKKRIIKEKKRLGRINFWEEDSVRNLLRRLAQNHGDQFGLNLFTVKHKNTSVDEKAAYKLYQKLKLTGLKKIEKIFLDNGVDLTIMTETNGVILDKLVEILTPELFEIFRADVFWNEDNLRRVIVGQAEACGDQFGPRSFDIRKKNKSIEEQEATRIYDCCKRGGLNKLQTIFDERNIPFVVSKQTQGKIVEKLVEVLAPELIEEFRRDKFWNREYLTKVIERRYKTCGKDFGIKSFNLKRSTHNDEERDAFKLYQRCKNLGKNELQKFLGDSFDVDKHRAGQVVMKLVEVLTPRIYEKIKPVKFWTENNIRNIIYDRAKIEGDNFGLSSFLVNKKNKSESEKKAFKLYKNCLRTGGSRIQNILDKYGAKFDVMNHTQGEVVEELVKVLLPEFIDVFREDKFWNEQNLKRVIRDRAETYQEEFGVGCFNIGGKTTNQEEKDAFNLYSNSRNAGLENLQKIFDKRGIQFDVSGGTGGEIIEKLIEVLTPDLLDTYRVPEFWTDENLERIIRQTADDANGELDISFFRIRKNDKSIAEKDAARLYNSCRSKVNIARLQQIFQKKGVNFCVVEKDPTLVIRKLVQVLTPDLFPKMILNEQIKINQGMIVQYAWECVLKIMPHILAERLQVEPRIKTKLPKETRNKLRKKEGYNNLKPDNIIYDLNGRAKVIIDVKLQTHSYGISDSLNKYTEILKQYGEDDSTKYLCILCLNGKDMDSVWDEKNNILVSYINIGDYLKTMLNDSLDLGLGGTNGSLTNMEMLSVGRKISIERKMKLVPIVTFLMNLKRLIQNNGELESNVSLEEIDMIYRRIRSKLKYMARNNDKWLIDDAKLMMKINEYGKKVDVWKSLDSLK